MDRPTSGESVVEVRELRYTIDGRAIFDGLNLRSGAARLPP